MKRLFAFLAVAGVSLAIILWFASAPQRLDDAVFASLEAHTPDLKNGENLFWAGGCASCHAKPGASADEKTRLDGGHVLKTEFGDFVAPNISSDATHGIGGWSIVDFANAMKRGVSPDGRHYYPAFPYSSYAKMRDEDVADLFAFMQQLPSSDQVNEENALKFPFNIRRGVGLWKRFNLSKDPIVQPAENQSDSTWLRGRYLVEGAGHCGECHTPRGFSGGLNLANWLHGAPDPSGDGNIPGITNGDDDLGAWSAGDIAYALETGFTPEFDSFGGSMADVVLNYAKVDPTDREAIATYLKSLN